MAWQRQIRSDSFRPRSATTRRYPRSFANFGRWITEFRSRRFGSIRSRTNCSTRSSSPSDQQIAVAPETGSDRLRRVINKNLTNDEIVDICGAVFDRGMLTVKLYMMVGLPTETQEDLDEMFVLVERIKDRMLEAGKKFGRAGKIIPSLNGFVPKPNTPLQWDAHLR